MWDEIAKGAVEGIVRGILSRKADSSSGQVEAQSFVLRDSKGRGRAILAMLDKHEPGLILLNSKEEIKAQLGVDKQGAYLAMFGDDGSGGIMIRMQDNEPELDIYDANDVARVMLRLTEGNAPELGFYDANGDVQASLGLEASGPSLCLWDENEKRRVQIQMDAEDGPSVVVFDENEEPIQDLGNQE